MKFLCTKNCCFCCLVFAYFRFVSWFLLVLFIVLQKLLFENFRVCPDNLIYYTAQIQLKFAFCLDETLLQTDLIHCSSCHRLLLQYVYCG